MSSHQNASTLEEIERRQISANVFSSNDNRMSAAFSAPRHMPASGEPESPNTVLRRTLNIAPPIIAITDSQSHRKVAAPHSSTVLSSSAETAASFSIPLFRTVSSEAEIDVGNELLGLGAAKSIKARVHNSRSSASPDCLITPQSLLETCFSTKVIYLIRRFRVIRNKTSQRLNKF